MMAERARRRPRQDWAAVLEAQAASGQTAGVYCREHGIPYKSFLYQRRKARAGAGAPRTCAIQPSSASAFVPVRVTSPTAGAVLRLFPGIVVECERLPEAGWLADLARRLMRDAPSC
jgi:hypothetical protein